MLCEAERCWAVSVTVGLFCCMFAIAHGGGCPSLCLCVSDLITCGNQNLSTIPTVRFPSVSRMDLSYNRITSLSSNWTSRCLDRLHTLILNHNSITHISSKAFSQVSHLKHLDLSSNKVSVLNASAFQDLVELQELLLFNNGIVRVDPQAFSGLHQLQRMYLSHNQITQFPLELFVGKLRLSRLGFLDLSYNLLHNLPVEGIISLPTWQQSGLYLHQNPLACDCTLWAVLLYWSKRHFSPATDFRADHKCVLTHFNVAINVFTQMDFMNCSNSELNVSFHFPGKAYKAHVGSSFVVHCDSKVPVGNAVISWVSPSQKVLKAGARSENLVVFPNGSLGLSHASCDDSGTYTCIVVHHRRNLNETTQVTIQVTNSSGEHSRTMENFHTAFTTLASCVVSVVLVLIYLYLWPCPCRPGATPSTGRGEGPGKRVMFLEPPTKHGQNGILYL